MDFPFTEFQRYDIVDVDDPLLNKYKEEINETAENKTRCLNVLRRELKNVRDIEPCLEEEFLLVFLRVSKYDTSKALQRVIKYYKQFDVYLEIYRKLSFSFHEIDTIRHLAISPFRCADNSFLVFGNAAIDYRKFGFAERFYLEMLALPEFIENPVNQICGGTFIFDNEGLDYHGYLAFTPSWLRILVDAILNIFPCRLKAIHIVNMPSFFPIFVKLIFPFLPKKVQERVFFHAKKDGWKRLHSSISPAILPERYGGQLKNNELIDCLRDLKGLEDKFHKAFAFGNVKTKKARQSLKVLK